MIASLMMYRRLELDTSIERLWVLIRENLEKAGIVPGQRLMDRLG